MREKETIVKRMSEKKVEEEKVDDKTSAFIYLFIFQIISSSIWVCVCECVRLCFCSNKSPYFAVSIRRTNDCVRILE